MRLGKNVRLAFYSFISWLVPFLFSIPFFASNGQPVMDARWVHSILLVFGSLVGAVLLLSYLKPISKNYLKEGLIVGFAFLFVNWALDIAILLPMSGMDMPSYFGQIGLSYLLMPIMAVLAAKAIEQKVR